MQLDLLGCSVGCTDEGFGFMGEGLGFRMQGSKKLRVGDWVWGSKV